MQHILITPQKIRPLGLVRQDCPYSRFSIDIWNAIEWCDFYLHCFVKSLSIKWTQCHFHYFNLVRLTWPKKYGFFLGFYPLLLNPTLIHFCVIGSLLFVPRILIGVVFVVKIWLEYFENILLIHHIKKIICLRQTLGRVVNFISVSMFFFLWHYL